MENQEANAAIELPKPIAQPEVSGASRPDQGLSKERSAPIQEAVNQNAGQPQFSIPSSVFPALDPISPAAASPSGPAAGSSNNPVIADDVDLIEKEWVRKAKEIVARTRQDPYNQNKELTSFRADYMKKRYGKQIEVTDN